MIEFKTLVRRLKNPIATRPGPQSSWPGLGLGGAIGQLHLDSDTHSIEKWDANFAARAFINAGFLVPGGIFGVQGSYMRAGALHFADNVGGDVNQFYIGVFGSLMF